MKHGTARHSLVPAFLLTCTFALGAFDVTPAVAEDAIAQFLKTEKIPVPTRRPSSNLLAFSEEQGAVDSGAVGSITALAEKNAAAGDDSDALDSNSTARGATLANGLKALSDRDPASAIEKRDALPADSLERKVLSWAIATSGLAGIRSSEIERTADELSDWPAQSTMRVNAESALVGGGLEPQAIIALFDGREPESVGGAILLAKAHLQLGNSKAANAAIQRFWHKEKLLPATEKRIQSEIGEALTREDHRQRMMMQFYRERAKDGQRMASLAGLKELGDAWTAVLREEGKAGAKLDALPDEQKKQPAYLFLRAKLARRAKDLASAAAFLDAAPRDPASLVEPDEWWVERRLISRALLDAGDAQGAYRLAAAHTAESPQVAAEAEFHAGWYALRFLKNPKLAARHFERILMISSTPISQARGHYWMAQSLGPIAGRKHLIAAARHDSTFYGQLAAASLGNRRLAISEPRPSPDDRTRFASRELVRAIVLLENLGQEERARLIYKHLAETLSSPQELALLAARAENRGDRTLALQLGKTAHGRGLEVDSVSWPLGAIPKFANVSNAGRALAYAIARQESAFNVSAVSPANARGLLQLLPGTAKDMAKKQGYKYDRKRLTTDAAYNAALGSAYLSQQLDNFDNSYILTFVGYNAGPGRVKEWIAAYGDPRGKPIAEVVDWMERIPFTETRNYVQRVMENYQVYKARMGAGRFDIESDLRFGRR